MKWMIKLGEDCDYEDYDRMLKNHELDGIMPVARDVVDQFRKQYPTVPIDGVTLVINKEAMCTTKIHRKGATVDADKAWVTLDTGEGRM